MILRTKSCAFHSCARPCSLELKSCGGCTCYNMNWEKAIYGDDSIINKVITINYDAKELASKALKRRSTRR